jgi:GxxExxY protein
MPKTEAELNRIAYEIIGGGVNIHRRLGPGCFESAYVPCLAYELTKRALEFRTKVPLTLRYEAVVVPGAYEADFIVESSVIIEVKAIERVAPVHVRQLQTYLRLSGCPLGLILNFGATTLTEGVKRQVNNFPEGTAPHTDPDE